MKIIGLIAFILITLSSIFAQEAQKIDEFSHLMCDDYLGRISYIRQVADENPSSKLYVLIYEGRETQYNSRKRKYEVAFPNYGSAKAKIASIKLFLEKNKFTRNSQFVFIEAGFRNDLTVEAWLVPNGATSPKSTPTLKKMKYRKGKPKGFCLGCC